MPKRSSPTVSVAGLPLQYRRSFCQLIQRAQHRAAARLDPLPFVRPTPAKVLPIVTLGDKLQRLSHVAPDFVRWVEQETDRQLRMHRWSVQRRQAAVLHEPVQTVLDRIRSAADATSAVPDLKQLLPMPWSQLTWLTIASLMREMPESAALDVLAIVLDLVIADDGTMRRRRRR